ncbi:HAD family phosphatase [Streptomyces sp. NBC_01775]|uniref:HAD family hydrolase n=1 Tax=Streptomyces sp. NBC_01775 TaxID=2975939 RepID=UPI002DDC8EAC|nr:HAD family phosphatase [Streptomyces sp. NBC_01775]WSB76552.1 HAD family phosphatase [Streptomyces sp. NBC_01775]
MSALIPVPVAALPRPRAVVFDCDGTLMDTLPCADMAYDAMFARRDRRCPDALRTALTGVAVDDAGEVLVRELGGSAPALSEELNAELVAAVGTAARPLPGALDAVRRAAAVLPVAIASNSFRALLDKTLAKGGLAALVPVTVAGDEVARPKPAPDVYAAACAALGVPPGEAVAVEDTALGIRAAASAGLTVIGIGTPATCPGAHAYVTGLDDPALAAWPPPASPGAAPFTAAPFTTAPAPVPDR